MWRGLGDTFSTERWILDFRIFLEDSQANSLAQSINPSSYSREYSLLSAARLTIGLFPCCMMGLFPCSRQTMEAWKRSSCLGPGGLLSKDEPHFESQPKKKQRCLEGEAVWIECGSILLRSVFYCSAKKEASHSDQSLVDHRGCEGKPLADSAWCLKFQVNPNPSSLTASWFHGIY